jgi:hypothetical protein
MVSVTQLPTVCRFHGPVGAVQYSADERTCLAVIARFTNRLAHRFNRHFHQLSWVELGFGHHHGFSTIRAAPAELARGHPRLLPRTDCTGPTGKHHRFSALRLCALCPLLHIYEGCGRAYLGEVEGANLIKIHRQSGKLSYLVYPDFDADPHPALLRCVRLNLRSRQIDCHDYAASVNPPVLHRKETFLLAEHPRHAKFARLTAQEEKARLLEDAAGIGTREGWAWRLRERGYALRGHQLVRSELA